VHPATAQPSVHSRVQEPSPQQSRGAGDARVGAARAPSARRASASAAFVRSIVRARRGRLLG
jgi:hypothetical protein